MNKMLIEKNINKRIEEIIEEPTLQTIQKSIEIELKRNNKRKRNDDHEKNNMEKI